MFAPGGWEGGQGIRDPGNTIDVVGGPVDGEQFDQWRLAVRLLAKGINGAGKYPFEEVAVQGDGDRSGSGSGRGSGENAGGQVDDGGVLCHVFRVGPRAAPAKHLPRFLERIG